MRPLREAYARAVIACGTIDVVAGIEYRPSDRFAHLRDEMRQLMRHVSIALEDAELDEETLAAGIELALRGRWPDRAYFIEVGNDSEGWIQIFQPWGIPRNDHQSWNGEN